MWRGLAVLRGLDGRSRIIGLVLIAVVAQIARNWLALRAIGLDVSVFDAIAVLIALVTLSQLPLGPSVGAVAVVVILGSNGVALAAAAGVLLSATGLLGRSRSGRGRSPTACAAPAVPAVPIVPAVVVAP